MNKLFFFSFMLIIETYFAFAFTYFSHKVTHFSSVKKEKK